MQLLIIENNPILEENFTNQLSFDKKINFSYYSNINIIKEIIPKKEFDFIIVSSLLPEFSSYNVIEEIFNKTSKEKIIQILEKINDKKHKLSKLCFKKPININKILSSILKYQDSNKQKDKKNIHFKNGIIFNRRNRQLIFKYNSTNIRLTEKESDIIHYLNIENKFINKTNLLKIVWGFNERVKTRTLETHIYRLRKKIKNKFGIKKFIIVDKNFYKLN